jgi:hypothetical protein
MSGAASSKEKDPVAENVARKAAKALAEATREQVLELGAKVPWDSFVPALLDAKDVRAIRRIAATPPARVVELLGLTTGRAPAGQPAAAADAEALHYPSALLKVRNESRSGGEPWCEVRVRAKGGGSARPSRALRLGARAERSASGAVLGAASVGVQLLKRPTLTVPSLLPRPGANKRDGRARAPVRAAAAARLPA